MNLLWFSRHISCWLYATCCRILQAQQLTGVAVPSYYNPAAVNPLKYAEQLKKRKMLWSKAPKETTDKEKEVQMDLYQTLASFDLTYCPGDSDVVTAGSTVILQFVLFIASCEAYLLYCSSLCSHHPYCRTTIFVWTRVWYNIRQQVHKSINIIVQISHIFCKWWHHICEYDFRFDHVCIHIWLAVAFHADNITEIGQSSCL